MKNTKLITLGIALAGVTITMAQDGNNIRERTLLPSAEDGLIEQGVAAALAEQEVELAAAADRLAEATDARKDVRRKMVFAQAGGGGMAAGFGPEFGPAAHQRSPRALVIPNDASGAEQLGEVEEDLGVMAHILDKAVSSDDKAARAMGIAVFSRFPGAATAPQNLYLEGHGAIFLLNVNYPLVPPNQVKEAEANAPVNNEWEEARREIARPGKVPAGVDPFEMFEERYGADSAWNVKRPWAEYDAEKVEELKKDVISALKNAANIRRLKADETVTVVVTGAEAGVMTKAFKSTGSKPGSSKGEHVGVARPSSGERTRRSEAAKLVIRVRKADAEAFQNGKLSLDDFRTKVTTMLY